MLPLLAFAFFSCVLLFSAFGVVFSKQAVHAALNLVLAFFTAACLWVMLDAEFLALVLVLVYVGAVMVLFLFVLMMLDFAQKAHAAVNTSAYKGRAALVVSCLMVELAVLLYSKSQPFILLQSDVVYRGSQWSVREIALKLFNDYPYSFEAAGAILLFAMVAAIGLIKHFEAQQNLISPKNEPKRQNIADQVRVKKADRLVLVKSS
jgi:NADH-quinone oxidoreductase subunit J